MIVYGGGFDGEGGPNLGARYNPATNIWTPISPSPYFEHTMVLRAIWTGNEVIFSGNNYYDFAVTVASYDPATGRWTPLPHPACEFGAFVWTGHELFLWGNDTNGCAASDDPRTAQLYTPSYQNLQTIRADVDSYVAQGQPTGAFGSESLLWSGYDPKYKYYTERVLTHFPLNIPSRAIVTQAAAYLYLYGYSTGASPMNITAYRATAPWTEGSTWQTASNNYDPVLGTTVSVGTTFGWYNWNVTSIVQKWMNGTAPNHGLMFNGNQSGARNERVFIAREAGTTGTAYLSVTYTDPFYAPDTTPPTAALATLPALQLTQDLLSTKWSGSDQGRGVQSFDVQVSDNGSTWIDWYTWAVGTSASFTGQSGHTYCFRIRARDYAGNLGSWTTASRCTTFYADTVSGQIVDQRHAPVVDAALSITPAPVATQFDPLSGQYLAYLTNSQPHQVSVNHLDYALPPTATVDASVTDDYDIVLQPLDNVIQNANFELPLSTGWITSGMLPIASSTFRHSGDFAVALNADTSIGSGSAILAQSVTSPVNDGPQTLSFMYTLNSTAPFSQSTFSVGVTTSDTITSVFTTTTPCLDWCHHWIDLSAWQGQSITVTFALEQFDAEAVQVVLDEATLGTWLTPLVQQVTPARLDAYTTSVITVTGENFLAEPLVLIGDTPVSTSWLSTTALTATVPNTLTFGAYSVQVQNPTNHRGAWSQRLIIGHQIYLPIVNKDAP